MNEHKVLIIDDEPDIRELLTLTLSHMGINCDTAASVKEGIEHINLNSYSLILTDMRLPDNSGLELIAHAQKSKPQTPVAVITAYGNIESAVASLKAGAFDYVSKPIDLQILKDLVNTALSMQGTMTQITEEDLVGDSPIMHHLREQIYKLARSQAPIFIQGASGVGKELVAQQIHVKGPRRDKPFIPVNCGAIPSELMESEFFGHKKGSFTGAVSDKTGLFLAAQGGTLFLDEVAELPVMMQVKLLRAIQEKAIKPIGESYEMPVDVRILSASHKNLTEEIAAGRFRHDLYYRINVIELVVPPLNAHLSDIPALVQSILKKVAKNQHRTELTIQPLCFEFLQTYHFPGNVRELENILERAVALCEDDIIKPEDLNIPQRTLAIDTEPLSGTEGLTDVLHHREKELILDALDKTKWNRTAAARILGVSFRTLRYKLKKLGLD